MGRVKSPITMKLFKSRKVGSRYEYEIEPGKWVSRQRINQMRNRKAHSARTTVNICLKTGTLKRQPCEKCGKPNAQFHHWNYDDAYAIIWLCEEHHNLHSKPHVLNGQPFQSPRNRGRPKGKWISPYDRIAMARSKREAM